MNVTVRASPTASSRRSRTSSSTTTSTSSSVAASSRPVPIAVVDPGQPRLRLLDYRPTWGHRRRYPHLLHPLPLGHVRDSRLHVPRPTSRTRAIATGFDSERQRTNAQDEVDLARRGASSFTNNVQAQLGLSLFLPRFVGIRTAEVRSRWMMQRLTLKASVALLVSLACLAIGVDRHRRGRRSSRGPRPKRFSSPVRSLVRPPSAAFASIAKVKLRPRAPTPRSHSSTSSGATVMPGLKRRTTTSSTGSASASSAAPCLATTPA